MNEYRSRAEAQATERVAIWGHAPFHQREQVVPSPIVRVSINGTPHDIHFDNFGRLTALGFRKVEG